MMYDGDGDCKVKCAARMREAQYVGYDGAMGLMLAGDLNQSVRPFKNVSSLKASSFP